MRWFWTLVWNLSELTGIGLGRYAPFVFERMLGVEGEEIDSLGRKLK